MLENKVESIKYIDYVAARYSQGEDEEAAPPCMLETDVRIATFSVENCAVPVQL